MALIVQKFGGSSVADVDKIKGIAKKIAKHHNENHKVVVVVSAMGKSTDLLLKMANQIHSEPPSREMDMLLSTGEQVSIALLAMALDAINIPAISFTGSQVGIITTNIHCKARINEIATDKIIRALDENKVVIIAGFQGRTLENEITTLGRGGSDTTAVALAASLKADFCEINTDVQGVYTSDPRIVEDAVKLNEISYDEMLELASLGAGILHPRSVELAKLYNVPLSVRSSFSSQEGTRVVNTNLLEKEIVVTGVTRDLNVSKIGLFDVPDRPGLASKIFTSLADESVNVDMIVQSAMRNELNDIAFTIPKDDLKKALEVMSKIKDEINISEVVHSENVAKVSIVGAGMITSPGVAAKMFTILAENNVNLKMISTSEIKVSCIVDADEADRSVRLLHDHFNLACLK